MGKITSMHFAGWKLGLKTGLYYLRTMAASAPIQFTVDQEALLVEDTNVARALTGKRRGLGASPSPTPAPGPRPMFASKTPNGADPNGVSSPNGVPTPSATPPVGSENKLLNGAPKDALASKPFKADVPEGESPKVIAAESTDKLPDDEALPEAASNQEEDGKESADREGDIYSDAALACSIENKEACIMCSG